MNFHCKINSHWNNTSFFIQKIIFKLVFCSVFFANTTVRPNYTIRLKFSNFFIHHYFQIQMFENFKYAFNMSSDAQIHVSRRVCVLFSRPRVATLRLKNHANHVPSIPRASHVINFCFV